MPIAISMPFIVTIYGAAAIGASILALLLASTKRRDAQSWAFWSFLLPPIVLLLLFTRRNSVEEAGVREIRKLNQRDAED